MLCRSEQRGSVLRSCDARHHLIPITDRAHPLPRPLVTLVPLPIPLPLAAPAVPLPRPVCPPTPTYPLPVVPATPPLVLLVRLTPPLPTGLLSATALLLSSSSALLCASSLRLCSSTARLSTSACRLTSSFSASSRSWLAPCHVGFKMSRWLCSVWLRMRVHVARSVEALFTVLCTVPIFSFAFSREDVTPSITRLTSRTRSSSARSCASRSSVALWCEDDRFCAELVLLLGVCFWVVAALSGLANRSSSSSWMLRRAMSGCALDFDMARQWR